MSGIEPLVVAEVAGPAVAAEVGAAEVITAALAEAEAIAAAEALAAETAATIATEQASQGIIESALTEAEKVAAQQALETTGANALEQQAFENFLRFGPEADMPGATMRSIQAGLRNAPLNTITSLPQYMGMPAMPPGMGQALQMARLVNQPQQGGTRTSVSPPMLNRGKEVSLAAPVYGLLGGAPMPKRRRLSLI
jgi:hypothetical protein